MQEKGYYNETKELIINNEVNKSVKNYYINRSDLETKYNIGKILSEAGKHYGESIIKKFSIKLTNEFGKGYTSSNLKYFRQFYIFAKRHTLCDKLTWSNYRKLLSLKNDDEINYYFNKAIENQLSYRMLNKIIKSNEYERLPVKAKNKLINNESLDIKDTIPEPILIQSTNIQNEFEIKEKQLQSIIVENISEFMKQLGNGYSYIDKEYKIKINNEYNKIDILLFNIEFNSYVVVELKVTELRKEYFSQIKVYMNYIDKYLKKDNQNNTIGILIVKENNEYVLYYSDGSIITRTFKLICNYT